MPGFLFLHFGLCGLACTAEFLILEYQVDDGDILDIFEDYKDTPNGYREEPW